MDRSHPKTRIFRRIFGSPIYSVTVRWHTTSGNQDGTNAKNQKKNKMATEYHGRTRCAIYLFHKWGVKWPKTKRQDPVDILLQECAILGVSNPRAANSSFFVPLLLKTQKIQKNSENSELHIYIYVCKYKEFKKKSENSENSEI